MPLTLKITSKQRHILGPDSTHVFSVHGGTVGRGPDNDWVLPDPDRFISGHHAMVDYRAGAYYLTDTSTNGVYVNDSDQPVGKGTPLRLYDGDRLRMGDYQFEVSIVNVSRNGADDRGDGAAEDEPVLKRKVRPEEPLSLKVLGDQSQQEDQDAEGGEQPQHEQKDSAALNRPTDTVTYPDGEPSESDLESVFAATGFVDEDVQRDLQSSPARREQQRPAIEFAPEERPASGQPAAGGELAEAVRLLAESIGIEASRLPPGSEHEMLVTIGHMVRATVDGLTSVLRTRALIKGQLRLTQTTIQPGENNPLKFAPKTQDALEQLFYRQSSEFLPPTEAVDEAFKDLRAHQAATVVAMKAAFHDLLERLEPEELEEKFERGLKPRGLLGGSHKGKYWDLYREIYQQIANHSDENFANIVGPKFSETFDREVFRLTGRGLPPRRVVDE